MRSIRVWFKDNGIGIAPENHDRIFRLFERIHPAAEYEGTGIGLTIVRKAVERMDAQVGFESEPGKGSNFWIQLKKGINTDENNSPGRRRFQRCLLLSTRHEERRGGATPFRSPPMDSRRLTI